MLAEVTNQSEPVLLNLSFFYCITLFLHVTDISLCSQALASPYRITTQISHPATGFEQGKMQRGSSIFHRLITLNLHGVQVDLIQVFHLSQTAHAAVHT